MLAFEQMTKLFKLHIIHDIDTCRQECAALMRGEGIILGLQ